MCLSTNLSKQPESPGTHCQLQKHLVPMMDDPACHLDQLPAEGGYRMSSPRLRTGKSLETDKEIVGDDADPEENSIRIGLSAGHPMQAESVF